MQMKQRRRRWRESQQTFPASVVPVALGRVVTHCRFSERIATKSRQVFGQKRQLPRRAMGIRRADEDSVADQRMPIDDVVRSQSRCDRRCEGWRCARRRGAGVGSFGVYWG